MSWFNKGCGSCLSEDVALEIQMWGVRLWCRKCALEKGGTLGRRRVALHDAKATGFTPQTLQALADGGIMDPNILFLPDGKVSMEEARRREQAGVERLTELPAPSPSAGS